jgi:hypothetical protein
MRKTLAILVVISLFLVWAPAQASASEGFSGYVGVVVSRTGEWKRLTALYPTLREAAVAAAMIQYGLSEEPTGTFSARQFGPFRFLYSVCWSRGPWCDYHVFVLRR